MQETTIPKGSIVQIEGLPFSVKEDTVIQGVNIDSISKDYKKSETEKEHSSNEKISPKTQLDRKGEIKEMIREIRDDMVELAYWMLEQIEMSDKTPPAAKE